MRVTPVQSVAQRPACYPRRKFTTREAARAASVSIAHTQGWQRLPEPCSKCNGWHLS
jgi:hypothetical protein